MALAAATFASGGKRSFAASLRTLHGGRLGARSENKESVSLDTQSNSMKNHLDLQRPAFETRSGGGGFLHKISWEAKYGGRSIGGWCKFPVAIKTEANYTATVM